MKLPPATRTAARWVATIIAGAVSGAIVGAGRHGEAATPVAQPPAISAPVLTTADLAALRTSIDALGTQMSASESRLSEKIADVRERVGRLEGAQQERRR